MHSHPGPNRPFKDVAAIGLSPNGRISARYYQLLVGNSLSELPTFRTKEIGGCIRANK